MPPNSIDLKAIFFDDFWGRRTKLYTHTVSEHFSKSAKKMALRRAYIAFA